jgi:hypothetical protein
MIVRPVVVDWSGLVTISNCGGSDADNVCGTGTMTKKEGIGWNNRVWDDQPCCWNCDCNGARWKQVGLFAYCGFSAWDAAGSTNKDGNHKMVSYMFYAISAATTSANNLRAGQGGPDDGFTEPWVGDVGAFQLGPSFFGVHLPETGADLLLDGVVVHSIVRIPFGVTNSGWNNQYRFGCASFDPNTGYTDLQYHFGSY